ncbi:MAG: hypothetical protein JWP95_464 [Actinotalea sp.]|nr:hypothetical protein [Actinotalea sp.]
MDPTGSDAPAAQPSGRPSLDHLRSELASVGPSLTSFQADLDAITRWAAIVRAHHDLETVPRQTGADPHW